LKIIIKRSFERTRQIAEFVPVKAACEATIEYETNDIIAVELRDNAVSSMLDEFVQSEVEKTLMGYTPACIQCGGKQIFPKKVLNKEGICAQCVSEHQFKARELANDAAKNARTNPSPAPKPPESGKGRNYREI